MGQSERLNILQVITPRRFAGAERVCAHLAHGLTARGHRVHVVAPPRLPAFQEYVKSLGVPFVALDISGKLNPRAARLLAGLARDLGADLLHSHLSSAGFHTVRAARRAGVPAVVHVHAMSRMLWYRGADLILACTKGVARHVRSSGLVEAPVQVVYNGLLADEFERVRPAEEVRAELGLPGGAPVIGVVGSLTRRKGHVYLLRALAELVDDWPELTCLLLGAGPLRGALSRAAARLGLADRVRFLGYREDRLDFIQVCDLVALPSIGIEGFGLCLIEAAMFGIPSVASRLPGVDEAVLDGETGLLAPPRDAQALAGALARLLSNEEERLALGKRARRRVRTEFTVEAMTRGVEEAYRRVLARRAGRGKAAGGDSADETEADGRS